MVRRILAAVGAWALSGCAALYVGGEERWFELRAPESFRSGGEPYTIFESDPWHYVHAEGCILPGETKVVRVTAKVPQSLRADVPRASTGDAHPDFPDAQVMAPLTGAGTREDPHVVRWRNMARWQSFVAHQQNGPARYQLSAVADARELHELLASDPALSARYDDWIADSEGATRRNDPCR